MYICILSGIPGSSSSTFSATFNFQVAVSVGNLLCVFCICKISIVITNLKTRMRCIFKQHGSKHLVFILYDVCRDMSTTNCYHAVKRKSFKKTNSHTKIKLVFVQNNPLYFYVNTNPGVFFWNDFRCR